MTYCHGPFIELTIALDEWSVMAADDPASDPVDPPTPNGKPSTRSEWEHTPQALATASREAPPRGAGTRGLE